MALLVVGGIGCVPPLPESNLPRSALELSPAERQAEGDLDLGAQAQQDNQTAIPEEQTVPSLERTDQYVPVEDEPDLAEDFSETANLQVAADGMPVAGFIHYVFGELLGVNYVIAEPVRQLRRNVTLKLNDPLSPRRLVRLSRALLRDRGIQVRREDEVYRLEPVPSEDQQRPDLAIGVGRTAASVPDHDPVLQLVPLEYAGYSTLQDILRQFTNLQVRYDNNYGMLALQGTPSGIREALGLVRVLDRPSLQGRHITVLRFTFIRVREFQNRVVTLLQNEGLGVSTRGGRGAPGTAILTALPRLNSLVVFSPTERHLQRIAYWADKLDIPERGAEGQFFVYTPQHKKASNLGQSLQQLLDLSRDEGRDPEEEPLRLVVDERQNLLIFRGSGTRYQNLLPVIRQMDIPPKQVALEVMVAEVTLTDQLRNGIEWFLRRGEYTLNTRGNLGLAAGALEYAITTDAGDVQALINILASENRVQILSSPRLIVRDGQSASINVGTEIPLITTQATNADEVDSRLVQNIQYRSTGITLNVTPVINGRGNVALQIAQNFSEAGENTLSGVDSPTILNRSIQTNVVADDGQMIILGGLISENNSQAETRVPVLGEIPLLGALFRTQSASTTRTELVVMLTPRLMRKRADLERLREVLAEDFQLLQRGPAESDGSNAEPPTRDGAAAGSANAPTSNPSLEGPAPSAPRGHRDSGSSG